MLRLHTNCCFDCDDKDTEEARPDFKPPSKVDITNTMRAMRALDMAMQLNKREMQKESDAYVFLAKDIDSIDFNKIYDDLSYQNPFCIVETAAKDTVYALIHHTVSDKLNRSVASQYRKDNTPHKAITSDDAVEIQQKEISRIVKDIKDIKRSQWVNNNDTNVNGKIAVKVSYINTDHTKPSR